MELPFSIDENPSMLGNVRVCLGRSTLASQSKAYNAILSNRLVSESLCGKLYNHQLLASRYLFCQDSILLMHDPGTGKTETTQFAMMTLLASGLIKRVMIVNTSENHNAKARKTFRALWDLAGSNRSSERRPESFGGAFDHLSFDEFMKEFVSFNTYTKLDKSLVDETVDHTGLFDHTGVIFDEAHNLVSEAKSMRRAASLKLASILASSPGAKVILSTATPVINEASSFETIKSILLRSNDASQCTLPGELSPASGGHTRPLPGEFLSHKSAVYDHLRIIQMYNPSDPLQGIINDEATVGLPFELKIYRIRPIRWQLVDIIEYLLSVERENFMIEFDEYSISSLPGTVKTAETDDDSSNATQAGEPSTATSYTGEKQVIDSCIYSEVVKRIKASKDGVAVVYMSLRVHGSIPMSKLLEEEGFEPYTGVKSDTPKYLLYDSNSSKRQRKLFEDAKRPDNWDGSIVKVILGSRGMRDGVDIPHVSQIHIALPEWHIPGLFQAWHRGIRSNGHNWLIYNRALELMRQSRGLTLEEAKKLVKIDYEVYNYIIDLDNLTDTEIDDVRVLFRKSSNRALSNDEIKRKVAEKNPSFRKIEIALRKYKDVANLIEGLKKTSLDHFINSGRIQPEPNPEENLFFTAETRIIASRKVVDIITEHFKLDTDELIRLAVSGSKGVGQTGSGTVLSRQDVISSLANLVKNDYLVFVPRFGHKMRLNLNENSVFLTSDVSHASQDSESFSNTSRICVRQNLTFEVSEVRELDLCIAGAREVNTINKLKRTLERAFSQQPNDDDSLSYAFLEHLTNFWGFSEERFGAVLELKQYMTASEAERNAWNPDAIPRGTNEMSFYILSKHVSKCSIHVKQRLKDVLAMSLQANPASWVQLKSSIAKHVDIIRPISLVERYEAFDFSSIPETQLFLTPFAYRPRTNGLIMLKVLPKSPLLQTQEYPSHDYRSFVEAYLDDLLDFSLLETRLVSIKRFCDSRSKGRQFETKAEGSPCSQGCEAGPVRAKLIDEVSNGIYMLFFPYTNATELASTASTEHEPLFSRLVSLKQRELREKNEAEQGRPGFQHRILLLEYMCAKGEITPERKQELYRQLWEKPAPASPKA